MAAQFEIDCALMSGRSYQTSRSSKTGFPSQMVGRNFFMFLIQIFLHPAVSRPYPSSVVMKSSFPLPAPIPMI